VILEMNDRALGVIGFERTAGAPCVPLRAEHEMMDDELIVPAEQVGERLFSLRRVEDISLLDFGPGKGAALGGDEIAQACQRLLVLEMRLARGKPFVA
jgi:hypothetical protein